KRALKALAREHRRLQKRNFARDIDAFMDGIRKRTGDGGPRFAPWARLRLRPVVDGFFAAVPKGARPRLKDLHAFRIQAKELRYTMEMLDSAFPASFREQLTSRIEGMQERLGEINDVATRRKRFEQWRKEVRGKAAAHRLGELIALDASRLAQ